MIAAFMRIRYYKRMCKRQTCRWIYHRLYGWNALVLLTWVPPLPRPCKASRVAAPCSRPAMPDCAFGSSEPLLLRKPLQKKVVFLGGFLCTVSRVFRQEIVRKAKFCRPSTTRWIPSLAATLFSSVSRSGMFAVDAQAVVQQVSITLKSVRPICTRCLIRSFLSFVKSDNSPVAKPCSLALVQ
jgi:hypothetical protein